MINGGFGWIDSWFLHVPSGRGQYSFRLLFFVANSVVFWWTTWFDPYFSSPPHQIISISHCGSSFLHFSISFCSLSMYSLTDFYLYLVYAIYWVGDFILFISAFCLSLFSLFLSWDFRLINYYLIFKLRFCLQFHLRPL